MTPTPTPAEELLEKLREYSIKGCDCCAMRAEFDLGNDQALSLIESAFAEVRRDERIEALRDVCGHLQEVEHHGAAYVVRLDLLKPALSANPKTKQEDSGDE